MSRHPRPDAPLEVHKSPTDNSVWQWTCWSGQCDRLTPWFGDTNTHAEALAEALEHCKGAGR